MTRTAWPLLVISSVLALAAGGAATTRPHYGGSLRVTLREAPASLDPARLGVSEGDRIFPLIFEGLTRFDARSRLLPLLATRWQADARKQRWQFWLRPGVSFHDRAPLTPEAVAACLRLANPNWTVSAEADAVTIETAAPDPQLAAELALPRNGIARRAGSKLVGTGPFLVSDWQPGRTLALAAFEDYWGGRPFLDSAVITLGQNWRQQMVALELGKADVAEVAPEQARRAAAAGRAVVASAPCELIALVFTRDAQSADEVRLRHALSSGIDRASLVSVLLQGQGEAAQAILPNWMTGYAMLFEQSERQAGAAAPPAPSAAMRLSYDAGDPASQLIAERVALNARDLGIQMQTTAAAANPDVRLLRIPLGSPQPQLALQAVAQATGLAPPQFQDASAEELYGREKEMLQSGRIIPLAHVPRVAAIAPAVKGWRGSQFGDYPLADLWLGGGAP